jgi:hypothetical protein
MTRLAKLNLLVFVLLIGHVVDHSVNQPARHLPVTGGLFGIAGFVLVAASATVALRRHPAASAVSLFAGVMTAIGFVAIHLLPDWSGAISDPYWDFNANALSWLLLLAPLGASIALALTAARELHSGAAAPSPST